MLAYREGNFYLTSEDACEDQGMSHQMLACVPGRNGEVTWILKLREGRLCSTL